MDNDFELDPELQAAVESSMRYPRIIDLDARNQDDDEETTEEPSEPDETEEAPETGEPDETTEEPTEPAEGEPGTPEPPAAGSEVIELSPGVILPREQALAYYEFDAILRGDTELQHLISEHVRGRSAEGEEATSPGTPTSPSPTLELPELSPEDLEDPTIAALYNIAKTQQTTLQSVEERLAQISDVTFTREAEEIASLIATTKESFSSAHQLSSDEMDQVAAVAERLNLIPSLMSGIDPVTGAAVPRDRTSALNRAFDIAYWYLPQFREREVEQAVTNRAKSTKRKQRLAGVSGTSGSVPKTVPVRNEQDRREAMIRDVAEMLGQTREE